VPQPLRGIVPQITLIRPEPGPTTLKAVPWGGRRLAALRNRVFSTTHTPANTTPALTPPTTTAPTTAADDAVAGPADGAADGLPIGESWEFSTLPGSESRAQGRALSEVLGRPLPFLAKLIDTAAALSIQVHPEDDPASGRLGKEEAWIVLDAEPGASVLAGAADGVGDRDLARAMEEAIARPERGAVLLEALRKIPVERGMVILVPAGTVHSIGAGILLAEIQQPTDCTYRLFDYGSDRPIHPDASRAAWRIEAQPRIWRPGEPSGSLQGRHVALHVQTPGESLLGGRDSEDGSGEDEDGGPDGRTGREAKGPRLLVAVGEGVRLSGAGDDAARDHAGGADEEGIAMAHGDLLLHLDGALRVSVDEGSLLVSGTIRD